MGTWSLPWKATAKAGEIKPVIVHEQHSRLLVTCFTVQPATCWTRCVPAAYSASRPPPTTPPTPASTVLPHRVEPDTDPDAAALWRAAGVVGTDTTTARYLASRGITIAAPAEPRHLDQLWHPKAKISAPAMVPCVQRPDGRGVAVQVTHLTADSKTKVKPERLNTGSLGSGAVRLALAGQELGLAEGTETALSAMLLWGVPCWATLGAWRLSSISVPSTVKRLVLFADADKSGRDNAAAAVDRYRRDGLDVEIRLPWRRWRLERCCTRGRPLMNKNKKNTAIASKGKADPAPTEAINTLKKMQHELQAAAQPTEVATSGGDAEQDPDLTKFNSKFAVVSIGGKTRVMGFEEDAAHPGSLVPVYWTLADFRAFHAKERKTMLVPRRDGETTRRLGIGGAGG